MFIGWKPIIFYLLFGLKNQFFRNKSGKAQPIRTKLGIRGQAKRWQRSGNFGRDRPILGKMGAGMSPGSPIFYVVIQTTFRQLRNGRDFHQIWPQNVIRCPVNVSGKIFSKSFTLAPEIWNRKPVKQAPHSEQATGHGMHCREILFTPRCSARAMELPRSGSTFLYDVRSRSYGASKLPNFRIFAYSPYTKRLKSTCRWPA